MFTPHEGAEKGSALLYFWHCDLEEGIASEYICFMSCVWTEGQPDVGIGSLLETFTYCNLGEGHVRFLEALYDRAIPML